MLKVRACSTRFHTQRWLLDANDIPIVKLREKSMTAHQRWVVYKGESKDDSDIIFSTKTKHMITWSSKTDVNVLLANNISGNDGCDFKIKGCWSERNCTISVGNSSKIIAKMHKVQPLENKKIAKDKFMVTIYPNVDYAFVVAIIAIIDAMNNPDPNRKSSTEAALGFSGSVLDVVGSIASS